MQLALHDRLLNLDRPQIMGIVNVTPDSFSDGGEHATADSAVAHALKLLYEGATILDIGGESTRPGASCVSEAEELSRVLPVVKALAKLPEKPVISVDTSRPQIMRECVKAGAHLINDVRALTFPGALSAALELNVPVILMHMQQHADIRLRQQRDVLRSDVASSGPEIGIPSPADCGSGIPNGKRPSCQLPGDEADPVVRRFLLHANLLRTAERRPLSFSERPVSE